MMAGLFLIFTFAMIAMLWQHRSLAIGLILFGIILGLLTFWHHIMNSDPLQITL